MDSNLFEYLIIIFFVVSALKSLFGKKKKQRQKEQQSKQIPNASQQQRSEVKKESTQQILEQMFGLKIPEEVAKQPTSSSKSKTETPESDTYYESSWNPEQDFEDSGSGETVGNVNLEYQNRHSKTEYADLITSSKRKAEPTKKIISNYLSRIEESRDSQSDSIQVVQKIKQSIKNPESLREYILVSELLNKPKALRR